MTNLSVDMRSTQGETKLSSPRLLSDLCALTVRILVLSRTYSDTSSELSLSIEGVTSDGSGFHRVWAVWFLERAQIHMGGLLVDAQVGSLMELRSTPGSVSLQPDSLPESVFMCFYGPDYEVVRPGSVAPFWLDQLFDHLDMRVDESELYDESNIHDECLRSPVSREDLLESLAGRWGGSRWFRLGRTLMMEERDMASNGQLGFRAQIQIANPWEVCVDSCIQMASRLRQDLRLAIREHPTWFSIGDRPLGTLLDAVGVGADQLEISTDIIQVRTNVQEEPQSPTAGEQLALSGLVAGRSTSGLSLESPPEESRKRWAEHTLLLAFPNTACSMAKVLFSADSSSELVAFAFGEMVRAYVFPEAIAMNDFADMRETLSGAVCEYSVHEFDLRWGGVIAASERIQAAMKGRGNTFAVLSYPMSGFDIELPHACSTICGIAEQSLHAEAAFSLSCSLNIVSGRAARLSLFCCCPGEGADVG